MANYSRWSEVKGKRPLPSAGARAGIEQDLALGQLIYDLRTEAELSQRELADRMGTTQSVISRLEEGGGARNRIDTLARGLSQERCFRPNALIKDRRGRCRDDDTGCCAEEEG